MNELQVRREWAAYSAPESVVGFFTAKPAQYLEQSLKNPSSHSIEMD
ncbi:MAG TPA: hypothetical protein VHG29_10430 [Novosphingobium sp.]|nr:hypothetical protein [Novosphingobium sp.]